MQNESAAFQNGKPLFLSIKMERVIASSQYFAACPDFMRLDFLIQPNCKISV
jgi:hypothetical protein